MTDDVVDQMFDVALSKLLNKDEARNVHFDLTCQTKAVAFQLRDAIANHGFQVKAERPPGRYSWWVVTASQDGVVMTTSYLEQNWALLSDVASEIEGALLVGFGYDNAELEESHTDEQEIEEFVRALEEMHAAAPVGWIVTEPAWVPLKGRWPEGHWAVYAHDPTEGRRRGRRHRECLVTSVDQMSVIREATRALSERRLRPVD